MKMWKSESYVILYGGQPNPAQNSQAIYGTSHYTKTLGSDSFSLDAYTTGDGALSYASSDTSVVTVDQEGGVTVVGGRYGDYHSDRFLYGQLHPRNKGNHRCGERYRYRVTEKGVRFSQRRTPFL